MTVPLTGPAAAPGPTPRRALHGLLAGSERRLAASAQLRRSLTGWMALGAAASLGFAAAIAQLHGGGLGTAIGVTLAGWLAVSLVMAGGAVMLVDPQGAAVDRYGVPNGLSALRAWLCVPLLLVTGWTLPGRLGLILWVAVGGSVGMLDAVDGWWARRFGPLTQLGKAIDPAMDVLYFSVAAIGNIWLGIFTGWLAGLILFRYLAPMLLTPIVFAMRRRPELVRTPWGKRNTVLTGVVLTVCMLVDVAGGPVVLVNAVVGLPLLVPTMLLHFRALFRRVAASPVVR